MSFSFSTGLGQPFLLHFGFEVPRHSCNVMGPIKLQLQLNERLRRASWKLTKNMDSW